MTKATNKNWGIHWFRRDLRVFGNEALHANRQRHQGRVLGIFCFDSRFLSREDFSHNRFAFFLNTLAALRHELQAQGGDLLVVDAMPQQAFPQLIHYIEKKSLPKPTCVSWGKDYEPYARARDQEVERLLQKLGLETLSFRDHLLLEPHEVLKDDDSFYQVFSPYGRKWFAQISHKSIHDRIHAFSLAQTYYASLSKDRLEKTFHMQWKDILGSSNPLFVDSLKKFQQLNKSKVTIEIPKAGALVAYEKLIDFEARLDDYKVDRDFPSLDGTSGLAMYLKNGSLVCPQILSRVLKGPLQWSADTGRTQFVKELVWREFYYSILFHRPEVETQSFLPQYKNLAWGNNKTWFHRWQEGQTGFPIVDAGMRQLKETGWMHNRVRMIVASFLTKDLLIDWRWGENHFMKLLLDGDLAANNGGWQWAASTGCDPQPYFRIFNPWLQSKKFDPEGIYIKKFVPELKATPAKALHDPLAERKGYAKPIVVHERQRPQALRMYKS